MQAKGGEPVDCPVSGGCHRAATGNIAIFAGGERAAFERLLPVLKAMGRRILHTGPLGSASVLKVVTNYLATANLVSLCEALATAKMAGMDLNTTYEAIRISSGNSFVHETESQVILNGSRDINFTMDLVSKDIGIFGAIAERAGVPLEIAPLLIGIFRDGEARYGAREWSPNIVRRLEEACGIEIRAPGFPAEMVDDEPEQPGYEVVPKGRDTEFAVRGAPAVASGGRQPACRGGSGVHRRDRRDRRRLTSGLSTGPSDLCPSPLKSSFRPERAIAREAEKSFRRGAPITALCRKDISAPRPLRGRSGRYDGERD